VLKILKIIWYNRSDLITLFNLLSFNEDLNKPNGKFDSIKKFKVLIVKTRYRHFREPLNGLTHFVGIILAIIGTIILILQSTSPIKPLHITTFSIFSAGLVLLYTASTCYHWLDLSEEWLIQLQRVDHMLIFVLIAASYTPVCLIALKGAWGWSIFGVIWGITVFGIVTKVFWLNAPRWFSTLLYLAAGWVVIIAIWPLTQNMTITALSWLVMGGLFYTIGAVIYAFRKPNPISDFFGYHEIFHLFILAGSISHWVMMSRHIAIM
jgi:hemolysin III